MKVKNSIGKIMMFIFFGEYEALSRILFLFMTMFLAGCNAEREVGADAGKEDGGAYCSLSKAIRNREKAVSVQVDLRKSLHIPKSIEKLTNLEYLSLKSCNIRVLPIEVGNLASLVVLDLQGNSEIDVRRVVEIAAMLPSLRELRLADCNIDVLPDSIKFVRYLELLNLNGNSIAKLPNTICDLERLEFLSVSNNPLVCLPDSVFKMRKLRSLRMIHMTRFKFDLLGQNLAKVQSLKMLDVRGNDFLEIPNFLFELRQLDSLILTRSGSFEEAKCRELRDSLKSTTIIWGK